MRALFIAVATLAIGGHAWSADLRPPPPAYAPGPYNWSGYYLGANLGYGAAQVDLTATGGGVNAATSNSFSGLIGGMQFGANYQFGQFVLGAEADVDANTQSNTISTGVLTGTEQVPWFATFRGRAGVAFDRFLVYGTAGGAAVELRSNLTVAGNSSSTTGLHAGWTAGGGLEFGITDYVTARLEYLYLDTSTDNAAFISAGTPAMTTTITGHVQENLVRAGINVLFPVGR